MAKKKKTRTVYRDSKTGKRVSESKWKRSKAHGGTRYKRRIEKLPKKKKKKREAPGAVPPPPPTTPLAPNREYIVAFKYTKTGKSFDVIAVATSDGEAYATAKDFLKNDPAGQRIVRSNFRGWESVTAEGKPTSQPVGSAEYRAESELL